MNRFFKYKVGDEKYALTEEEHGKMVELIQKGDKGFATLRKGTLIINLSFIRTISEIKYKSELEKMDIPEGLLLTDGGK